MKALKPVNRTVLVKVLDLKKTKSNLTLMAKDSDRDLIVGEIISVSDDVKNEWRKGQKVVFGRFAASLFRLEGETYYFLSVEDIIGILE